MRSRLLLTLLFLCLTVGIHAQMGKYFTTDNHQLSSSFVSQVYLDHDGFLWVTTRNGINRYDGYQFRVFKKENEADKTLASNYVNCMIQDRRGLFYFGMYGALQTWDGEDFHHVTLLDYQGKESYGYATCFLERANGDVLAGSSGLGLMKITDRKTARQLGGEFANLHTVSSLLEDKKGRLWIVSDQEGLVCYDGQRLQHYLTDRKDLILGQLCSDRDGNVFVATNAGLYRQQGSDFVHVAATGHKEISSLYCNSQNSIIIGYDGKGIAIYDPRQDTFTDNPFFSQEVDLSKSKVYSITEDNSGNLWFGMLQKGIFCQPITSNGFQYMGYKLGSPRNVAGSACVVSVLLDSHGVAWEGTDKDGIYVIRPGGQLVRHLSEGYPSTVMTMAETSDGRIWIGSYGEGGGSIDPRTFQYKRFNYPQDDHLVIMDIEVDAQDRLWMATMRHGVICYNPADGQFRTYVMRENAPNEPSMNSITNDYISQISFSPDGARLYVATSMGLCCLDIASDSWTKTFGVNCLHYSVPIRVAREYDGQLWYGTNLGLYCYDLKTKQTKHYTVEDGLPSNGIAAIERDQRGLLWISTDHGLCSFDPVKGAEMNYFADDGLQSNEFSDGASWTDASGTILFGGTGGVTWFNPMDIKQSQWSANVHLTALTINGEPVSTATRSGGRRVTETTINASNHFELGYHDNSFTIQLSTLTYENPEHIVYLYSINGEPFRALPAGTNELSFTHLPPGTYRFRVKAERSGIETPQRDFTVIVRSPWYRSAWAYFFYALVIGLFVWQFLAYRHHREQNRLRLQAHIHAEEMSEAKLRFFMNISHDIRTPMTLILTPLLSLIKKEDDPERKSVYETIRRNAERILSLINQMMDLRKIDKGQMQMRMSERNLVGFVNDIYTLFDHQAKMRQIKFTYDHDCEELLVWIDRSNFDKVVVNVLSNAFKYTPAGGEIGIRLTHDDTTATIAIRDNGEKIPEDKLEKIFQRFYQAESATNDRNAGTGIGLDLTRSLVEMHHGTITVHNLDQGCEFVITIPLGNAHLTPEEMISESELPQEPMAELQAALEQPEEEEEIPYEQADTRGTTIVIAEDDDEIRNYLEAELSKDYDVHACVNGREALTEIYRVKPSLVVSDVMMPELDGNALCSQLKTNSSTNYIPVILLTARNRDEDRLEGLETGADAYIVKPFNMDILRRTILNLLNSRKLLKMKYERTDDLEERVEDIRLKSPDDKLLEKIMECIRKNLTNSDLNIDMISDEVGISRVHLHRKMKELTGQTPHDFIRSIRLKKAAQLLAEKGMNVTEVMYACGFANSASFSTIFRKYYGMSPRDYMKEHQER
ncbi:MAG: helix-turn-helix domain-containing protein [Prevotella sp.]|nr:helix-turn-helix domain-containing protein [Prevotella sp.]